VATAPIAASDAKAESTGKTSRLLNGSALLSWLGKLGLVGATAAAGYFLGPYLTNQWQTHQDTLARKQALVDRISQASGTFLGVVQLQAERKHPSASRLDTAFVRWQIQSEEIHTQIAAIEHEGDLTAQTRWGNYSSDMTWVYYLFRRNSAVRPHALHEVGRYLGLYIDRGSHTIFPIRVLVKSPFQRDGKLNVRFDRALRSLMGHLRLKQREVILAIKPQSA
jgi:hypothetical protein